MKIGFDLDGVLYSWHKYFYEVVSKNTKYSELGYVGFWSNIKALEEGEDKDWFWNIIKMPSLYNKESIDRNVLDCLKELANNNDLYYITARPKEAHKITRAWVHKNKLPHPENLFIVDKSKKALVSQLHIDFYLEDRLEHLEDLKDVTRVLLIKQPWNNYGEGKLFAFNDTLDALIYLIFMGSRGGRINGISR